MPVRVRAHCPISARTMTKPPPSHHLKFLFILLYLHLVGYCWGEGLTESQILLNFKNSLSNPSALDNWDNKTTPCIKNSNNWVGVICVDGSIRRLQLENMGLTGNNIDVGMLAGLPDLRSLSLMNNSFKGFMPELKKLSGGALRSVYFSGNYFSGAIPDDAFDGMLKLKKIYLANNEFTSSIPSSLTTLPKLLELGLEGNKFSGGIPSFTRTKLNSFNVSNNELEGPIPATLSHLDSTSFAGNKGLCGPPLKACNNSSTTTTTAATATSRSNNRSLPIILAVVGGIAVAAIIAVIFFLVRRRRQPSASIEAPVPPLPSNLKKKTGFKESSEQSVQGSPDHSTSGSKKGESSSKLLFVRDERERFDLPDLLKASAEILGSGCFGSSYKAAISGGRVMVVKRFKQMNNVGKEEFQEHMRRIGRLMHPNLLSLVAYYYRKEEKLLIFDFVERGSLAVHLHGHQALGQPSLDWPTRLKIVKGVTKGLAYLYKELPSIITAHGHLKSSNVLLNESYEPVLTDYGLVPVINQENAQELMVAYKSPEYLQLGRITKKTDVWSLGILVLEILTGKFPANFLQQGKGSEEEDLASWVNNIPREEWKNKVFDKELEAAKNNGSEGEMVKLLKIGLSCCEGDVEKRMDMKEAVDKIEEIKERDMDDEFYSSYASEGEMKSSRGRSDDFI